MSDESTTVGTESEEREDEALDAGSTRTSAMDLGDVTGVERPQVHPAQTLGDGDEVDYYRFTLTQAREMRLGLWHLEGDAELYLEDAAGTVLGRSVVYGQATEAVVRTLGAGTYYVRVEAQGTQPSEHQLVVLTQEPHAVYADRGSLVQLLGLPSFGEWSPELSLSEHTDGSEARVALGTVSATDPDGDALHYALVGGNESGRFAIDAETGELFYAGPGEDYEGGAGPHELTVRAGDGTHTVDATVTVTVTDVPEEPAFTQASYAFDLAENVDGSEARVALGTVSATDPDGDALHYALVEGNESGRFAIDAETGELFYAGPGEDHEGGAGPHELTVRVSDGTHTDEATHTVDATVTVTVTDVPEAPAFTQASYGFTLAEHTDGSETRVALGTVTATDPDGDALSYALVGGNESGRFAIDAESGELFYAGPGEDYESGAGSHELTVRASDGELAAETAVTVTVTDVGNDSEPADGDLPADRTTSAVVRVDEGPVRGRIESTQDWDWFAVDLQGGRTYRVDYRGSSTGDGTLIDPVLMGVYDYATERRMLPGTADNEGGTGHNSRAEFVAPHDGRYYIWLAGNGSERSGTGTYELEVRTVPAPVFGASSYAFALAENVDGSETSVLLGAVSATDPDGDTLRYRLVGGNESGLFAIDASSGELYYVGAGEDHESGAGPYELTVRASDGTHTAESSIIVTVTDEVEVTSPRSRSEPSGADLPGGTSTNGQVVVDDGPVEGTLDSPSDRDWFAVILTPGRSYRFDLEGEVPSGGTVPVIRGLRDSNGNLLTGVVGGAEIRYTTDESGTEAVYYVEVGGAGNSGQGASTSRGFGPLGFGPLGFGPLGFGVAPLGSTDGGSGYRLQVRDVTDDYASDTTTMGVVEVGGSIQGNIESSGDRDWFATTLEAGKAYRFDLEGSATEAGTLSDPVLVAIHDADGDRQQWTTHYRVFDDDSGEGLNSRLYFSPSVNGTYYVAAGANVSKQGTYKLSVEEVEDDFSATTNTTGVIEVGGSATGNIDYPNDEDWIKADLEAGKTYLFDLSDGFYWRFRDADGSPTVAPPLTGIDLGTAMRVSITPSEDTIYYVSVMGFSDETEYQLPVTDAADVDDLTAATDTTGTASEGNPAAGSIDYSGDRDWIAVDLQAGRTYRFVLNGEGIGTNTLRDPYLRGIHDANGDLIPGTTNDNIDHYSNLDSRVFFTAPATATYYVSAGAQDDPISDDSRVKGYDGRIFLYGPPGNFVGTYTLSMQEIDDFTAGTNTAGAVEVGGSVIGEIERRGDRDWFAVTLEAGTAYQFDLEGSATEAGTLSDPYLRGIYDDGGRLKHHTNDNDRGEGLNSRAFFAPSENGTYYVAAGANDSLGTYKLSVTRIVDDYTDGTDTAGTVEVGDDPATGEAYVTDRDWFAVTLERGKTYRFDLKGASTDAGALPNPYLRGIYDAGGNLIPGTSDDDSGVGNSSRVYFKAPDNATYYVAAAASGNQGGGAYELSVIELADDYTDGTDTTGRVEIGGSAEGEAALADRDWFAVTLQAGNTYRFDLEGASTGAGTMPNPYLYGVHDADGNRIVDTTDNDAGTGANSRLFFSTSESGVYYVAAGASGNRGGGTYTLSATDVTDSVTDDYAAWSETTGSVEVGGSVLGIVDYYGDRDWFSVDLEAGRNYVVNQSGWPRDEGSLLNEHLHGIYDPDGNLIPGTTGRHSRLYGSFVSLTSGESGTYHVAAGADGSPLAYGTGGRIPPGSYRLWVRAIPDDFPAWTNTSGRVAVGGSATGNIERSQFGGIGYTRDQDWFAVELEAGKLYRIDLEGWWTHRASTLMNPYLHGIYDADGNLIPGTSDDNSGESPNSRVYFPAPDTATYYISADGLSHRGGTYKLSVREHTADDFAAGTNTTGRVAVEGSVRGRLERPGDHDWFAVTLEAGKSYRIDIRSDIWVNNGWQRTYLRGIYDEEGDLIPGTSDDDGSIRGRLRGYITATEDGVHYLSATGSLGAHNGIPAYKLQVVDVSDDFAAGIDTTGRVTVGGSVRGEILNRQMGEEDRDWFAVTLEAGETYRIELNYSRPDPSSDAYGYTFMDPYLRGIHDAEGNLIPGTTDDDGGRLTRNSLLRFRAPDDGTYYIAAGAAEGEGNYVLSVTWLPDDYSAGTDTTGRVEVGGQVRGEIERPGERERDWFAVTLEAGKTYQIDLKGRETKDGDGRYLQDPYLYGIHDANGDRIPNTSDDNSGAGRDSRLIFEAPDSDTYYVEAGAHYWSWGSGIYLLSVEELTEGM